METFNAPSIMCRVRNVAGIQMIEENEMVWGQPTAPNVYSGLLKLISSLYEEG